MADLSQTLGASRTIELAGKAYTVRPPTLADWAQFDIYTKERIKSQKADMLSQAKQVYGDNIPIEVFTVCASPPTASEIEDYAATIDGCVFLLCQIVGKSAPEITRKQIEESICLTEIGDILKQIGLGSNSEQPVSAEPQKKRIPNRKPIGR